MLINSFDIDGVIFMENGLGGVYPGPNDVIITGRSIDEEKETFAMLAKKGIHNRVFFNPIPFDKKTRKSSAEHKAKTILFLENAGYTIGIHFEDDPFQIQIIESVDPEIRVVHVNSAGLVELENTRHL